MSLGLYLNGLTLGGGRGARYYAVTPPSVTGTATTEQTLTAVAAEWNKTPDSIARQWYRADVVVDDSDPIGYIDPVAIGGQTGSTYTIAISNKNDAILVAETATFGSSTVTVFSDAVGPIEYTDRLGGAGLFNSSAGFTLGPGWAIASGLLTGSVSGGTGTTLYNATMEAGTFRLILDIKRLATGTVTLRLSGSPQGLTTGSVLSTVGDGQYHDFVTSGNASVNLLKSANFDADIDNMFLYRIA